MFNFDFGAFPPEVNSGLMYAGPGSAPMMAAAAAWDGLAAQLGSATSAYSSVLSDLTSSWQGPGSTSMAAAAAPYVSWMSGTAAQAQQAASQARAAAGAFESAFAMTVPPPVVAANRSLLAALVATNILGQNTAAIAATEAEYGEMWAQDVAAMYGYAGDSAAAAAVTPFMSPPQTANPLGQALQAAQNTETSAASSTQSVMSQLMSAVPNTLQSLTQPGSWSSTPLADWLGLDGVDFSSPAGIEQFLAGGDSMSTMSQLLNGNLPNTIFSSGFYMPGNYVGTFSDLAGLAGQGGDAAKVGAGAAEGAAEGAADAAGSAAQAAAAVGPLGSAGGAVSAGLNQASSVGGLSVPYAWTTAAPEIQLAAQALPDGGLSAAPAAAAAAEGDGMLGQMALAGLAGRAMVGTSAGSGRPVGVTAPENRPLPIVIVKPPPSAAE